MPRRTSKREFKGRPKEMNEESFFGVHIVKLSPQKPKND